MFDRQSPAEPDPEVVARFDDMIERRHPSKTAESAALLEGICASVRTENQAMAAQLRLIGKLFGHRLSRCSETEDWAADTITAVAAEVAAALRISQGLAESRLHYARVMRERLPQVGAVFAAGQIDYRTFQTIVYRTDLITDEEILARVDGLVAVNVPRWPSLTKARLAAQVDKIVVRADKDALRQRSKRQAEREVWIGDDDQGVSEIQGHLFSPDAQALDARLTALAATVCAHDPRTRAQRRADALGALAVDANRLTCRCERPDCTASTRPAASPVVIHVIAEKASLDGHASAVSADGLITPELIAELATTAKLVPLIHPGHTLPEPGYTPSQALADFVRCRDLTCRWPGCDHPAYDCDVDHTIPHSQGGATHASNLKCYCRQHHLVKTFWGWREQQLPDGTLVLTSPAGQTYVTTPGSALLFPSLCQATGGMPAPEADPPPASYCPERTAMMPKRRRSRAKERAYRIATERNHNRQARATGPAPPPADDDPPPF